MERRTYRQGLAKIIKTDVLSPQQQQIYDILSSNRGLWFKSNKLAAMIGEADGGAIINYLSISCQVARINEKMPNTIETNLKKGYRII